MATQTSTITVIGKVGNLVGAKGMDGKYTARAYIPAESINNPRTVGQVYQRGKLALAAKVAGMLDILGQQVNVANGIKPTRRGALVRDIMAFINDAVAGPQLSSDMAIVKNPKASVAVDDRRMTVTAPTALTNGKVTYDPQPMAENGTLQRYIVALLVYNTVKDEWRSQVRAFNATDAEHKTAVYFPTSWAGDAVIMYGYTLCMVTDPLLQTNITSLGNLTGTTEAISMPIDSNGVAYGNMLFSQVDAYVHGESIAQLGN